MGRAPGAPGLLTDAPAAGSTASAGREKREGRVRKEPGEEGPPGAHGRSCRRGEGGQHLGPHTPGRDGFCSLSGPTPPGGEVGLRAAAPPTSRGDPRGAAGAGEWQRVGGGGRIDEQELIRASPAWPPGPGARAGARG